MRRFLGRALQLSVDHSLSEPMANGEANDRYSTRTYFLEI